jgi:Tol biopolymer transport system component
VFTRRCGGRGQLFVVELPTHRERPLLVDKYSNEHSAWSSDCDRIVFDSDRGGQRNVWDIDVGRKTLRQITAGPDTDGQATVSHGGTLLYWHGFHQVQIRQLDLATGADVPLTPATGRNYYGRLSVRGPVWSGVCGGIARHAALRPAGQV